MPVVRVITLNGSGGAFTAIAATIGARTVTLVEDGVAAGQGIEAQFPADGFAAISTYLPGVPIQLEGAGHDGLVGLPEQNAASPGAFNHRAADVYCKLRSATATVTSVRVLESESTI